MQSSRHVDVERLIDEFVSLAASFPDLDFPDSGGELDLRRRVAGVICLRIEIPAVETLRLQSVIIEADGLEDPVGQTTCTASSAIDKGAAERLRDGALFDSRTSVDGVHTKSEPRPWLEITVDRPVALRRLLLKNVTGVQSAAVRGVQVLARTEDGTWTTLYDGLERERHFVGVVERRFRKLAAARRIRSLARRRLDHRGFASAPVDADLARILTAVKLRDYRHISKDVFRLDLPGDDISTFRSLVSERITAKRELEWNIHGIKRSFRFWTQQEKQDYLRFALDVINCLKQLNDNVCLGFGSVLSVVRDQELMPHDDDLDVLVAFEPDDAATLAAGLDLIKQCLLDGGFAVEGDQYLAYRWVFPPGGGQKLDVFAGIFEGEAISWYPGKRGALTRAMMFPPRELPLLGCSCPVPRDPERYLEQIYGPGWTVPDPHFRHTWRRSQYADIAQ
jgi:hypothetical protein